MAEQDQPPIAGPSRESIAAQDAWAQLVAASLTSVRESAAKWRDGLAAMMTLVTAGLVVSGPGKLGDVPLGWQWTVAVGLVLGMFLVLAGLLITITVAAGQPKALTFNDFQAHGGNSAALEVREATAGARRLVIARLIAVPGVVLVVLAIGAWLVSPTKAAATLQVTTVDTIYCGELSSGAGGVLKLSLKGELQPATITFADVQDLVVVEECAAPRLVR